MGGSEMVRVLNWPVLKTVGVKKIGCYNSVWFLSCSVYSKCYSCKIVHIWTCSRFEIISLWLCTCNFPPKPYILKQPMEAGRLC